MNIIFYVTDVFFIIHCWNPFIKLQFLTFQVKDYDLNNIAKI